MPDGTVSQLIAVSSSWIDLCSADPLIASISRQVLHMEIAYASFCGFNNAIIPGPRPDNESNAADGLTQYARAVKEALEIGSYLQISISLNLVQSQDINTEEAMGSLRPFAREEYTGSMEAIVSRKTEIFGTWDDWHIIRTMCNYTSRLFVGKKWSSLQSVALVVQRFCH